MKKRIFIIANKGFEADPLVQVLMNVQARPPDFPSLIEPTEIRVPLLSGKQKRVRARLAFSTPLTTAEVWCISDLMDATMHGSSSEEKARVLPYLSQGRDAPDLVIALGTGAHLGPTSRNGWVYVGSQIFLHDPYRNSPNPNSGWHPQETNKLISSTQGPFGACAAKALVDLTSSIEARMLRAPLNASERTTIVPLLTHVGITVVNVTDTNDYAWADKEAVDLYRDQDLHPPIGSLDTTHGVIRLALSCDEFLYCSGITNRLGNFPTEVAPQQYAQQFVAAHNAAIALAWLLPPLMICDTSP